MRVIFFGTPHFAADVLTFLIDHGVQIVGVVSRPDRAQGRSQHLVPTPVKVVVQSRLPGVPLFQPEHVSSEQSIALLKELRPDLFVVVAYGEILKESLLSVPTKGAINLHASLLPAYRGAAPIQRALIAGEKETGVTIIHVVKKMDAGAMILRVPLPIAARITYGELEKQLCRLGERTLLQAIALFEHQIPAGEQQDISKVSYAPKVEVEECLIQWNRPAEQIEQLIRGVNPSPGAWCYVIVDGVRKRLKIWRASVVELPEGIAPGTVIQAEGSIAVATARGALRIEEMQLEGKTKMSAAAWLRGVFSTLVFNAPV